VRDLNLPAIGSGRSDLLEHADGQADPITGPRPREEATLRTGGAVAVARQAQTAKLTAAKQATSKNSDVMGA
jgi:hypothetical protein